MKLLVAKVNGDKDYLVEVIATSKAEERMIGNRKFKVQNGFGNKEGEIPEDEKQIYIGDSYSDNEDKGTYALKIWLGKKRSFWERLIYLFEF